MKKMIKTELGFTLVELLITILILGIVASISIIAFGNSRKNSIQSACKSNYQTTILAVQAYQTDNNGQLPASLRDLAPDYINAGLIDTDRFALQLQALDSGFNVLVTDTSGAVVRTGTLKSAVGSLYTYFIGDTTGINLQQKVAGSGLGSLISTNATYSAGATTAIVESTDGISIGMEVLSTDLPGSTSVSAVDSNGTMITLSNNFSGSGSSKGLILGTSPTVDSINPATGTVTVSGDGSYKKPIEGSKYILVFGGTTIPGTAPLACRSL